MRGYLSFIGMKFVLIPNGKFVAKWRREPSLFILPRSNIQWVHFLMVILKKFLLFGTFIYRVHNHWYLLRGTKGGEGAWGT